MTTVYWGVFRAALTIAVLSGLVKVVSVVKEGLVAYRVGTSPELDAFLLAYAFPAFLLNALSAVATVFVPVYVRLRSAEGEVSAARFAASVSWLLASALLVCGALLAPICASLIRLMAAGFEDHTVDAAVSMLYALMPVLLLNGLTGYWSSFLNAQQRFAAAAMVPLATPAAIIVALAFFWETLGIGALVIGTLAGGTIEVIWIGRAARRSGLSLVPPVSIDWKRVNGVLAQALPAAGGNVLIGATLLVDQAMAAMLAPGSVSALSYGTRVTGVLLAIGSMALATALLPHLSSLIAETRFKDLRVLLRQYALLTIAVTVPLTGALVAASDLVVRALFERGSFGASDSALVASIQSAYALQIPFFSLAMIAVRLITAMQANTLLLIGSGMILTLDIVMNWLLSRYLGVVGIALSTSVVYAAACVFLWIAAFRKLNEMSVFSVAATGVGLVQR